MELVRTWKESKLARHLLAREGKVRTGQDMERRLASERALTFW